MRRYLIFSAVSLALIMYAINSSAISVAFPVFVADYNISLVVAGWVLNAYQLVSTIVMPLAGKVSEAFGRKSTFMVYTLLFTGGSLLCALAPNIGLLIGFRVIQAIGGGGFLPCAAGIVNDEFPEARQRFIGLFSSIFPIGMIIGPNLGGWMIEAFGWRSIFWFNVPLGIVVLVLLQVLLSTGEKSSTSRSIDFIGAGLLLSSISALMFGLTEIASSDSGTSGVFVGAFFALGIILMFAFVRREHRAREPIIDLELLGKRPFLAANAYNLIYGISALGVFSLIPLYAVSIYKMSVFESGIVLTPRSVGMIAASTITSFSLMRWGYRWPILSGTLTTGLGFFLLSLESQGIEVMGFHLGATPLLFIILGLCGIGHGICTPAASNACIELMPDKVATITGLRGMFRQLGSVIGVAIGTVILHSVADMQRAFYIVLLGSALIILISIPTIFVMPAFPRVGTREPTDKSGN
jgi:EmrB/QacA subfamily drug resistance transporter